MPGEVRQDTPAFDVVRLGARIKEARLARHLPMRTVAQMAGVSVTHISQIERGRNCPTIGALARIATALGITLHYFLEPETRPEVRMAVRGSVPDMRPNATNTRLLGAWISQGISGGRLHVVRGALHPADSVDDAESVCVPAMQTFYVLEGSLDVWIGDECRSFSTGDAFVVQPAVRFRMHNRGPSPCEILSVVRNEQSQWIPGRGELIARSLEELA
ncbi:MAG: helix-turn-helix domain-containing protein [Candidatus Eisenbacteria bacterium]|nr:helix-turn-helix domain-containing protein [Candidatus Eisenbacteria bacterium]